MEQVPGCDCVPVVEVYYVRAGTNRKKTNRTGTGEAGTRGAAWLPNAGQGMCHIRQASKMMSHVEGGGSRLGSRTDSALARHCSR